RHIIFKERSSQGAGKVSRSRAKHVRLHRIHERGCESELMILKFIIELFESALSQVAVAFQEKRTVSALGERSLASIGVDKDAEFHVHIGQLRKCIVITIEGGGAQGEQTFLAFAQNMRT